MEDAKDSGTGAGDSMPVQNPAGESVISEERISSRRTGQIHAG